MFSGPLSSFCHCRVLPLGLKVQPSMAQYTLAGTTSLLLKFGLCKLPKMPRNRPSAGYFTHSASCPLPRPYAPFFNPLAQLTNEECISFTLSPSLYPSFSHLYALKCVSISSSKAPRRCAPLGWTPHSTKAMRPISMGPTIHSNRIFC
jgi:hypothetical protein